MALKVFSALDINFKFQKEILLFALPIFWAAGVWLGGFLSQWPALPDGSRGRFPFFNQFGKFAVVGFLGAAIDFSILNWVSVFTGITAGITLGWINVPGFLAAVTNNYLWNKLWVFKKGDTGLFADFPKFLGVTLVGLAVNSGIIIALTSIPVAYNSQIWLNISKVAANALALTWNFIGYKFFAFKKNV